MNAFRILERVIDGQDESSGYNARSGPVPAGLRDVLTSIGSRRVGAPLTRFSLPAVSHANLPTAQWAVSSGFLTLPPGSKR
jgi:hypothetical protein